MVQFFWYENVYKGQKTTTRNKSAHTKRASPCAMPNLGRSGRKIHKTTCLRKHSVDIFAPTVSIYWRYQREGAVRRDHTEPLTLLEQTQNALFEKNNLVHRVGDSAHPVDRGRPIGSMRRNHGLSRYLTSHPALGLLEHMEEHVYTRYVYMFNTEQPDPNKVPSLALPRLR